MKNKTLIILFAIIFLWLILVTYLVISTNNKVNRINKSIMQEKFDRELNDKLEKDIKDVLGK